MRRLLGRVMAGPPALSARDETADQEKSTNVRSYADWMSQLPDRVREAPVSRLTIPGSHNSFTYRLDKSGKAGPDQPEFIRRLCSRFPFIAYYVLYRWSVCQHKTATFQLEQGVRYFDIRLAAVDKPDLVGAKSEKKKAVGGGGERCLRVLHCLYGLDVVDVIAEIKEFLARHPKELVILDFQHLFNFTEADHKFLIRAILDTFPDKLVPCNREPGGITLNSLAAAGKQLIVIYQDLYKVSCVKHEDGLVMNIEKPLPVFWPRNLCPTPWPNTTDTTTLVNFLNQGLERRLEERKNEWLYVSQGVLTPSVTTVILHPFSSLQASLVRKGNRAVLHWLQGLQSLRPNILIADFLFDDECSINIVKDAIEMNYRI